MKQERETYFVDVILPLPLRKKYCYRVPQANNDDVAVGKRVIVPFGKKKLYSALIVNVHAIPPTNYEARYFNFVLDSDPIVLEYQLRFWNWIAEYYMCNPGDVLVAALPAGFKLSSETRVLLNTDNIDPDELSDKEYLIYEALKIQHVLDLSTIGEILQIKVVYPYIKSMLEKGAIVLEESVKEKYKPKIVKYVKVSTSLTEEDLQSHFEQLEKRAPKQLHVLMQVLKLTQYHSSQPVTLTRSHLLKENAVSVSALNGLLNKQILEQYTKEVGRIRIDSEESYSLKKLSTAQLAAYENIEQQFKQKDICLLHGVTSSGKTEIYVKLIAELLKKGKQALYLVPEIALTTQLITRLRKYFGNQIGVYHSGYSQNERVEIWNDLLNEKHNKYQVIIGPRSALFLPFKNLDFIIVDESHESSYKQVNPAPRYHARDAALVLGKMLDAKVLLGTATPSIESLWNAKEGLYGYVKLDKRFGDSLLPEILVADIKKERKQKTMSSHFSGLLMDSMTAALEARQQVILFQNRRGFNPQWQCEDCGKVPDCMNCDVSLTYHKFSELLKCHYCGYSIPAMKTCNACGSTKLNTLGFGTEKIESEIATLFPEHKVGRLDFDTTRKKHAYSKIIGQFESGEIDILVGTQMVTKGLDFERVAVVGILNADTMLNRSDFRAFEKSFQMMTQVSGRAGRKKSSMSGKVIVQTYQPEHWVIQLVVEGDLQSLVKQELLERRNFKYPPFYRLIHLTLKHRKSQLLDVGAALLVERLRQHFGDRVLGPEYPFIARVRNIYQKQIFLKIERAVSVSKTKFILQQEIDEFLFEKDYKSIRVVIDVDPQ